MTNWDYGNAYLEHPCASGTVIFEDGSQVETCDIMHHMPDFMRRADLIFVDPPWTQSNISSFYTKALLGAPPEYSEFHAALFKRIAEISPETCYVEMGKDNLAETILAMRKLYRNVTFFNSTYYHLPDNLCYVVRGGKRRPARKYDGMDEEDIIATICQEEDYTCIGDLCMGRGLIGLNAYKAGRRFVGTELNHKRLSVLLKRISDLGGTYIVREHIEDLIPIGEYARLIGRDPANMRRRASNGGFRTARKIGHVWMIDRNEPLIDRRVRDGKHIKRKSD